MNKGIYSTTLISGTKGVQNVVKGCPKRHLLQRVDHVTVSRFFLACASNATNSAPLPPTYPLFHHFCRPKISQAQKWVPTTYAPGLSKTAACAAYCMDRFNYKYGRPSYFLLASSLLQHANRPHNFLTQPSLNYLSPPKDHLQPARFCSHFQLVSRLYIAVLTYTSGLSSL